MRETMDAELRELYQDVILDHNKNPRNSGTLQHPDHEASGNNPLCGDKLRVTLTMDGDRVRDIQFAGVGCAISTASASMMTEVVKGKSVDQIDALVDKVHRLLTLDEAAPEFEGLEESLAALTGVREFPMRVKCATLPWHTLKAALHGLPEANTEEEER